MSKKQELVKSSASDEAEALRKSIMETWGKEELNNLAKSAKVNMIPALIRNNPEDLLIDQIAAMHKLSMHMIAKTYKEELSVKTFEKYIKLSMKLSNMSQKGIALLHKLKNKGKQTMIVKHQHVQVNAENAIVNSQISSKL